MSDDYVLYSTSGSTATITLNRPERLNAIVKPMWARLDGFAVIRVEAPAGDSGGVGAGTLW